MKNLVVAFVLQMMMLPAYGQNMHRLIPDFYQAQYGGSIGFISTGVGYKILNGHSRLSFHYGFVPESQGGKLNVVATKIFYPAWTIKANDRWCIQPLDIGAMVTYHFGGQFSSRWPSHRYPDGYYWWRTAWRLHLALEQSVSYFPEKGWFEKVSVYAEWNVNDLYLVSYARNARSLSLSDIVKLGVGVRMYMR